MLLALLEDFVVPSLDGWRLLSAPKAEPCWIKVVSPH